MSKAADNEAFAKLLQVDLSKQGRYLGPVDGWAGQGTISAWRASKGLDPIPAPPIVVPVIVPGNPQLTDLPSPAALYRLPAETNATMTALYGAPSANPANLDWFSFPDPQTRLYERGGTLLSDRSGDERLDHKCHKLLTGRLTAALAEIYVTLGETEYRRQGWHVYGGCHNYREKRGGSTLSTHAWGIAIDLCPNENTLISSKTTFSRLAVDIMEKWGFLSGGRAWNRDWMHFQAAIPSISAGSYYAINGLPKNIVRA
jgi:hypothetical protein